MTPEIDSEEIQKFLTTITREAGKIVRDNFGKVGVKDTKSNAMDVVTEADLASNEYLMNAIRTAYPTHGIISEESPEHQPNADWLWTIDPLDGTLNYARGIPQFAVMICLAYKKELRFATMLDVMHDQFFYAEKGKGAFCNGKKVCCSQETNFDKTLGGMGMRIRPANKPIWEKLIQKAATQAIHITSPGCAGIYFSYAANGRCDWVTGNGGELWDYAPGILILQEAGCKVTNLKGEPWQWDDKEIIAANPNLHAQLSEIIAQVH